MRVILLITLAILWVRTIFLRISISLLYGILDVIVIIVDLRTNMLVFTIIL